MSARSGFTDCPWTYPGTPLGTPTSHPAGTLAGGRPVVAFGSNTDPAVVYDKLAGGGVSTAIPMTPGLLADAEIAASAHISVGGYIPAAVRHRRGASLPVVVAWPDAEQLACLDATEPNYRPVVVRGVRLSTGECLGGALLYATRRDVIALPGRLSQVGVWRHVLAVVPGLAALCGVPPDAGEPDLREVMLAARDAVGLRARITGLLQTVAEPADLPVVWARDMGER